MDNGAFERHRRGLRASHDDRDRAVDFIRAHAGEGRLTTEELEERVGVALNAKTIGELDDLVVDLPPLAMAGYNAPGPVPPPPRSRYSGSVEAVRFLLTLALIMVFAGAFVAPPVVVLFWVVIGSVIGTVRFSERRRRRQARALAHAARLAPPPPITWQPPHTHGW